MPDIEKFNGTDMADIEKISGQDIPSGGGGTASTTPTISVSGGVFGAVTVQVTNHSSYTNPNYQCTAAVGGTTTITDTQVDHTLETAADSIGDTMSFSDTNAATGTRTVTVRAQEFGENIQSAAATGTYDVSFVQNRYIRIRGVTSAGADTSNRLAISELSFFTGSSQSGTEYPTTNLTSNTSETGIEVSQGHVFSSTYAAYKAVNGSAFDLAWLLSTNATNNWWQLKFESGTYSTVPIIKSMEIRFHSQNDATHFQLQGSDTGSFSGEETDFAIFQVTAENTFLNFG
tara:strand:+ start:162 stop:1025 length:864 start_codon:yes stop_codon:yes gene_type:complete